METHAAQDVKMVLMHAGQYPLADGGECAFVVGQKDCLNEKGAINQATDTYEGGWNASERRTWCNADYKNAFPQTLLPIFRQMNVTTANGSGSSVAESHDFFTLPAEKEVFGTTYHADEIAEMNLFQINYYSSAANQNKKVNGTDDNYWTRSSQSGVIGHGIMARLMAGVMTPQYQDINNTWGIAPFGCIGKKVV